MPVKVKIGESLPFPDRPGAYMRLAVAESPDRPGSVIILQGMVMLFHSNGVSLLETSRESTIDVIKQGDDLSRRQGITISYTPIVGIDIFRGGTRPQQASTLEPPKEEPPKIIKY